MKSKLPLVSLFALVALKAMKADASAGTYKIPAVGKKYAKFFADAEKKYNLPKNILVRIADQESDFRPDVTGDALEQGIMQIHPRWHTPDEGQSFYNPEYAIDYAGRYLRKLKNMLEEMNFSNNWKTALLAYNWGIGNVQKFKNGEVSHIPDSAMHYALSISNDIGV